MRIYGYMIVALLLAKIVILFIIGKGNKYNFVFLR